jgi:hypothetical protein
MRLRCNFHLLLTLAAQAEGRPDAALAAVPRRRCTPAARVRAGGKPTGRRGGARHAAARSAERLPAASGAALRPVDAARMTEILLGPEAAMAVLRAG